MMSLAAAVYVWLKGGQKAEAYSCPSVLLAQGGDSKSTLKSFGFTSFNTKLVAGVSGFGCVCLGRLDAPYLSLLPGGFGAAVL